MYYVYVTNPIFYPMKLIFFCCSYSYSCVSFQSGERFFIFINSIWAENWWNSYKWFWVLWLRSGSCRNLTGRGILFLCLVNTVTLKILFCFLYIFLISSDNLLFNPCLWTQLVTYTFWVIILLFFCYLLQFFEFC
jgi:hypothetical protein